MGIETSGDMAVLLGVAALFGAIGGIAADLLLVRNKESGMIELPRRVKGFFDLGTLATMIIGAVAGMAAIYVFPPETVVTNSVDGTSTTVVKYELLKLVPLALIVGSAGGAFLSAVQARVIAAARQQQLEDTTKVADQLLASLAEAVSRLDPNASASAVPAKASPRADLLERIQQASQTIHAAAE